jgi:hypothetical protein
MREAYDGKAAKPSRQGAASAAISVGATESGAVGSTSRSVLETVGSVRATLSHDQDHDGNYDGIADPLVVLCCALGVLWGYSVLLVPLVGRLLLRLCEPPILVGSDHHLALERPG